MWGNQCLFGILYDSLYTMCKISQSFRVVFLDCLIVCVEEYQVATCICAKRFSRALFSCVLTKTVTLSHVEYCHILYSTDIILAHVLMLT